MSIYSHIPPRTPPWPSTAPTLGSAIAGAGGGGAMPPPGPPPAAAAAPPPPPPGAGAPPPPPPPGGGSAPHPGWSSMRAPGPAPYTPPATDAWSDLQALGRGARNAAGRVANVGGAVLRNPLVNNPLTRTALRASAPVAAAAGAYNLYDELTDQTSRTHQHGALANQAWDEGHYGDALGEGAMAAANMIGAATGTRYLYDAVTGGAKAAPAAPAAAPQTPGNLLPIFAQNNQLGPRMPHAEMETPSIRIFHGGDATRPQIFDRNTETGNYDYRVPTDPKLSAALAVAKVRAGGQIGAAHEAHTAINPIQEMSLGAYLNAQQAYRAYMQNPRNSQLKTAADVAQQELDWIAKLYPRFNVSAYDATVGTAVNGE